MADGRQTPGGLRRRRAPAPRLAHYPRAVTDAHFVPDRSVDAAHAPARDRRPDGRGPHDRRRRGGRPARRPRRPRRPRPRADAGGTGRHRPARRERRGRLRRDDRVRRPRVDVHPARGRGPPPGEPARVATRRASARRSRARSCARCSSCAPTRSRSGIRAAGRCSSTRSARLPRAGIHPVVPEQGSVGASGDLAPLAHLALPLIGRGEVEVDGQVGAGAGRAPRARPRAARPPAPRRGSRCSTAPS